jgi:hypothetical protein
VSPKLCDGGTREEKRCHRRVHGIQGGGEDAEIVWAVARNLVTVAPREEERCHRLVHDIQGGGEDAETVWA